MVGVTGGRLAVALGCCAALVGVGVAGGALSPEHSVADPTYFNSRGGETSPQIACASLCLTVWSPGYASGPARASRISPDGAVLDGTGIAVGAGVGRFPAVATNGSTFLVVWMSDPFNDIVGARLDQAGNVLGAPFLISSTGWKPSVASDGQGFFVAWRQGDDVRGARVAATGGIESVSPSVDLSADTGTFSGSTVAAGNPAGYLVVWEDAAAAQPDIAAMRVSPAGAPVSAKLPIAAGAHPETEPAVASDGAGFLVLWTDDDASRTTRIDVGGRTLNAAGELGSPQLLAAAPGTQGVAAAAWNGSHYLVSWSDSRLFSSSGFDILARRFNSSGGSVGDEISVSEAPLDQTTPVVGALGSRWVAAWDDRRYYDPPSPDIYAARVAADGTEEDPQGFLVTRETNSQSDPVVVWNGSGYFAAWYEWAADNQSSSIVGGRLGTGGQRLDGAGRQLGTPSDGFQHLTAAAWNGSDYLVVWSDSRNHATSGSDIYGALVGVDGIRKSEFAISDDALNQTEPSVAWTGSAFLVVWYDNRNGPAGDGDIRRGGSDIYGARVSAAGVVQDTDGLPLVTTPDRDLSPVVASNGNESLVAWMRLPGPPPDDVEADVYAVRVGIDGQTIGAPFPVLAGAGHDRRPSVASDGSSYLVASEAGPDDYRSIRAARVSGGGAVADPGGFEVAAGPGAHLPEIAPNGTDYVVGWIQPAVNPSIRGRKVSVGGSVGGAFEIASGVTASFFSLTTGPPDRIVAAYTRRVDSSEFGLATRTFVRFVDPDVAPPVPPPAVPQPSPPPPPPNPLPQPSPPRAAPKQARCLVPNVRGRTLAQARRSLVARRCRLGRVKRAYSRTIRAGRVIRQGAVVGARLPRGTRVNVLLSRGRKRR